MSHIEQKGFFVVLYGANNVGKSAAIEGAKNGLIESGLRIQFVKYPIYDLAPTGPWLNNFLRHNQPPEATQLDAQKQFAQNRRDFEPTLIRTLNSGISVVAEDYTGTGKAWGETWGISPPVLNRLNLGLLEPDLAILIYGNRFKNGIEINHKNEQAGDEIWHKNQQIHLRLANEFGWRQVSNIGKTQSEVSAQVSQIVKEYITTRKQ